MPDDLRVFGEGMGNDVSIVTGNGGGEHGIDAILTAATLAAARTKCYSPYSGQVSAVGIRTKGNEVYAGGMLESAAFNPTLPPLQAALIDYYSRSQDARERDFPFEDIESVLLLESKHAADTSSQVDATRATLKLLAPNAALEVMHLA